LFQLFQLWSANQLLLKPWSTRSAIQYLPGSGEKRGKTIFSNPIYAICLQQRKTLMTFIALLEVPYYESGIDIYQRYKQNQLIWKKKCYIARNIMCFIMNIIIARQKFFNPSYYIILFSYRRNMFLSRNLSPNMPQSVLISLKIPKNLSALGALFPDPLCLRRLRASPPNPVFSAPL